jgi:hypothetical protein
VTNRNFAWTLITFIFFIGLALGGYDISGTIGTENLTATNPTVQSLEADTGSALADAMAPQAPAAQPGTELALYITQAPIKTDLEGLMPFNVNVSPMTNVFYKGSYLRWNGFTSQFPSTSAGLWIERSAGWSLYVTMPLNGWARELLYVPITSPISIYDIYPSGFVTRYNLGVFQPGYYNLWYHADTPGRHLEVFETSSGYSNKIVIDVYGTISITTQVLPKPVPPDPKKECEKNSNCYWVDGNCRCVMNPPPIPGPVPNPVDECEKNPGCFWADGQCQCPPGPVPNPNPEPMPGPVPNPNPDDNQGDNA